jgi:uncharacterized protein YfaS (alpha-2-macroglobulin family)
MMAFTIKQNDTSPALQATLKDYNGNPISLVGATVKFHLKSFEGTIKVNQTMTITNASNGVVTYFWQSGDTSTAGTYYAEFEVTYSDLSVETFPNSGNLAVTITPELA